MTSSALNAKVLIDRYLSGQCSPEECLLVESIYHKTALRRLPKDKHLDFGRIGQESWQYIHTAINERTTTTASGNRSLWPLLAVACTMAMVIMGACLFYFLRYQNGNTVVADSTVPGKSGSTLRLASGRTIGLSAALNGELAKEAGLTIDKIKDGQLIYNAISSERREWRPGIGSPPFAHYTNRGMNYHVLTTAKGDTYRVTLPDGSKVWLNADSKMIFAVHSAFSINREVELFGEAYFEVTHDAKHPFIVKTGKQHVEVIGTHFNVSSYLNEAVTTTTLLEGSVRITPGYALPSPGVGGFAALLLKNQVVLKPNQQSLLVDGKITVRSVDPEAAVSWKTGEFIFRNEPLENIMLDIARWYDVDVIYQDKQVAKQLFGGTIAKFKNIEEVLKVLEHTGDVKFKVEGRKITVKGIAD